MNDKTQTEMIPIMVKYYYIILLIPYPTNNWTLNLDTYPRRISSITFFNYITVKYDYKLKADFSYAWKGNKIVNHPLIFTI